MPIEVFQIVTESNFKECAYLEINADVNNAVKLGAFRSGHEHFVKHGFSENRNIRAID